MATKKVIEPFNIHLDAFWERDLKSVEKMIRKLDAESLKKLYGMTINITDKAMFPHPVTGKPMVGDTRYFREKPYLIILGKDPTPRVLYHEVAHAIGIEDETEAMNFAKQKERGGNPNSTCYEDAWRYLIKEEEGELIHGTVESLGRRIGHAWVELPTGFIWEPESRQFLKKADFEAIAKPLEEDRYSATEAAIMLARVGKHGPWTKEEKAQFLKRGNPEDKRLLKVAIEHEPLRVAKQLGYEIHRLSPKDIVDKDDYARGYRYRLSKTDPTQPYPQIIMARSESEVATFLKRQIEGNPDMPRFPEAVPEEVRPPKAVTRYKKTYGKERSVNFVEYEYGGERYITGTVVRGTDKSLGWYFGKGTEGLKEANRIALLSDEEFSKAEDLAKYSWGKTRKTLREIKPPAVGGNPVRVRFDRASIDSAIAAAKRLQSEKDLYIFATHLGFTIDSRSPPGMQQYVVVHPDGSTETIKPLGSNPLEPWQMAAKEYAESMSTLEDRYNELLKIELRGEEYDPNSPVGREASQSAFGQLKKETGLTGLTFTDMAGMGHKAKVRLALEQGKPVPPEVLRDYPELKKGGNPMRTEAQRESFHERVFGKGSIPPLERLGRGQLVNDLTPMPPDEGPPLPKVLAIRWPWKKP